MSGQILQLEDFLGATLFVRPPFALTPTGRDLYQFIQPFFDHLPLMSERIRGNGAQPVRIAATSVILRDHLPANEGVAKHFQAGLMEAFLEALQRRAQQLLAAQPTEGGMRS